MGENFKFDFFKSLIVNLKKIKNVLAFPLALVRYPFLIRTRKEINK